MGSVSDPDPDKIRIDLGQWVRIRFGNPDQDPDPGRIRLHAGSRTVAVFASIVRADSHLATSCSRTYLPHKPFNRTSKNSSYRYRYSLSVTVPLWRGTGPNCWEPGRRLRPPGSRWSGRGSARSRSWPASARSCSQWSLPPYCSINYQLISINGIAIDQLLQ